MELIRTHRALFATLVLTVLYALHYGIPLYATSSYLIASGISSAGVSFLYGFASLLTLFFSNHIAKYVQRYHTYTFTFSVLIIEIVTTIAFAMTKNNYLLIFFFLVHFILSSTLFVLLNIFVESFTPIKQTGLVRGLFLTLLNIGMLLSPLIGGLLISGKGTDFTSLYIVSSLVLIPYFFFLHHYLREVREPYYASHSLLQAFRKIAGSRDLRAAVMAQFALHSFYAIMVIYTPIYVTQMLHIPLALYLTTIAPIALIPLVILPYELGYLADAKYGEKEFMFVGLTLIALCSFALGLMKTPSFLLVLVILFISRVGASLVETMAYTYYYKKISKNDPAMSNFFTNITSLATFVVPTFLFCISPLLLTFPGLIYLLLGAGILSTLHSVAVMRDTK